MDVPASRMIDFVWEIGNVPISFREQHVRHIVGMRYGGRPVIDMIPEWEQSQWWIQSMRQMDMGKFAQNKAYYVPESINDDHCKNLDSDKVIIGKRSKKSAYREFMYAAENLYNELVASGVPLEDARNVLPLGCTHRYTWKCNIVSLVHILRKRSCWIAQLGMWEPIIHGIINELTDKVDPLFRKLIDPPCFDKQGKWQGCPFVKENEEYFRGNDPHFPCPLFMGVQTGTALQCENSAKMDKVEPTWAYYGDSTYAKLAPVELRVRGVQFIPHKPLVGKTLEEDVQLFCNRFDRYKALWKRDPSTGKLLEQKGNQISEESRKKIADLAENRSEDLDE